MATEDASMPVRLTAPNHAYLDMHNERVRAHEKHAPKPWGSMEAKPADHPVWLPVLMEEVGEVARVLCEGEGVQLDQRRLREELVQVGAMAAAWIAAIDFAALNAPSECHDRTVCGEVDCGHGPEDVPSPCCAGCQDHAHADVTAPSPPVQP